MITFPSPAVTVIDIPEVRDFKAEFVYNFFTKDESVTETSMLPESIRSKPSEAFDAAFQSDFRRIVPRFVRLTFRPSVAKEYIPPTGGFASKFQRKISSMDVQIKKNYDKIVYETTMTGKSFSNIDFRDSGVDQKLFLAVSGSVAADTRRFNARKQRQIAAQVSKIRRKAEATKGSLLDGAQTLNENTDVEIPPDFIVKSLNRIDQLGAQFIDPEKQKLKTSKKFDKLLQLQVRVQLNNKILGAAVRSIVNFPVGMFSDEFTPYLGTAKAQEADTVAASPPDQISLADFEVPLVAVHEVSVDGNNFSTAFRLSGYVIEKQELRADGTVVDHEPIFIEDAAIGTTADLEVKYGTTYSYSIRTIAQITLQSTVDGSDDIVAATYLVSSSPQSMSVMTIEDVPPPPPADFNVSYDYSDRNIRLMWNLPVNTQRDIKYFQIFRRLSVDEPFELLREYDFDDSELKIGSFETVEPSLVEELSTPKTFFKDNEFTKDSVFIYAVCCVDAHGMSSNYSPQYEVAFDKFNNKLVKGLVSTSGAPKSYPNLYLLEDAFVDVIKDSGHERMKIYFDPEFLEIEDQDDNDMGLLTTDKQAGLYKIQFINVDLQKHQVLDIIIQDLRQGLEE